MDRTKTVRNLRFAALAFTTGTRRDGVFGVGERVEVRDRAVGLALVIVGVIGVFGHVAQMVLSA